MDERLGKIEHVALDLDGTLYLGGRLFDFTHRFLKVVRELGIVRTFFTNNSSKSTGQYISRLRDMGIDARVQELFSSTTCTLEYLREERPEISRVYVVGTPALRGEIAENGFEVVNRGEGDTSVAPTERAEEGEPDAVVVGFDTTLTYDRLCRAAYWISRGKPFIATHCDAVCPTDQATVLPDCGAICKLLSHATGREPDAVLGKPHPRMLGGVMRRHGLRAEQIAVVGDRLYTDIAMARGAGALGVLVLSGETTRRQAEEANPRPDLVVEDVGELAEMFQSAWRDRCRS